MTYYPDHLTVPMPRRVALIAGSRRRSCSVVAYDDDRQPRIDCAGTYWSGGSCSGYLQVRVETGAVDPVSAPSAPPAFGGGDAPSIEPPPGSVVLRVSTVRGKGGYVTAHGRRSDLRTLGLSV